MKSSKKKIIEHHSKVIGFVDSLNSLNEKQWRFPIAEGKWTVAEVIGHLIPWDEFVLHKRIPFLFNENELPTAPSTNELNTEAAYNARVKDKNEIMSHFLSKRKELLKAIEDIPSIKWGNEVMIGKTKLSLFDYFYGLSKHDDHHLQQIKNITCE
ncbi:DinB family protein [Bacillus pseudomycoides]|uniref:DinB family protein n=1 Tax=Bacillus pseudomycoides TaxID=64104 RepID=UPI002B470E9F|nr:DinB family protein [Bacillus pseudomycoides]MEB3057347.1 DinB family protein [Bacillus pseudomycoides]